MSDLLPLFVLAAALFLAWRGHRTRTLPRDARRELTSLIDGYRGGPVTDAGHAPLVAVASALALHPEDVAPAPALGPRTAEEEAIWQTAQIIRPLGLSISEIVRVRGTARSAGAPGRTEMHGIRHGRRVTVRLREQMSEVLVEVAVPDFEIRALATGWQVCGQAPAEVREAIEDLTPSPRWHGLALTGGATGVRLHRPDESARSWMHDLWLAELVTRHALRAQAAPAPAPAPALA